jgi:sugar phosphate isomerase/epimerase
MAPRIGFIGIVRSELDKDAPGTLRRLREMGYEGMETGTGSLRKLTIPVAEHRRMLDDAGMQTVAMFTNTRELAQDFATVSGYFQALDCRYATIGWGPVTSREQLLHDAESYNRIGARLAGEGITLLYHNHDHEFAQFDGEYALDILRANTAPQALCFNVDIAWVTFGGADPVMVLKRFAGRTPVLHLKDLQALTPGCERAAGDRKAVVFAEVGTGIVDLAGVVRAVDELGGVAWADVEQDRLNLSPMDTMQIAREGIRQAGW